MGKRHVTWGLIAALALAVAACGPKTGESGQSATANGGGGALGGIFPTEQAAFKATYQMEMGPREGQITIYGSGKKTRTENGMMAASSGLKSVTLIDRDTMQFVSFMEGPNAPKRATKLSADDVKKFDDMTPHLDGALKPTKIGSDTVAGLSCNIWSLPAPADSSAPPASDETESDRQICVTDDGIMLRVGSAAKPRLIATAVAKGPQDPALFTLPAGYEVVDMGDCLAIMRQYAQSMAGGGAKPDQAKFLDCQKKMMSGMGAP